MSAFIAHHALPFRTRPQTTLTCRRTPAQTSMAAVDVKGSETNPYKIAVLAGDGAGPSVAQAAIKVLNALTPYAEIHFDFTHAPYGAGAYNESGSLITDETLSICKDSDAVLRSYQGMERGIGKDGSAHLQLRDALGLYAQFRPVIVYPQLMGLTSLREDVIKNVDIMLVREVSAGALGSESLSVGEESRSTIRYSADEVYAIADAAVQVAERRSGRILNVDKADAMSVSRFWRRCLHEGVEKRASDNPGIVLSDMFVDDFVREVILRPSAFDVVVTSNLFGDILAEVIAALAGPQRLSPSFWVNRDGLGVYGPADIYNAAAYPSVGDNVSPLALIRSASMMLRYALDEPAAADIIQQALRKTMADIAKPAKNGNGAAGRLAKGADADFADDVVRSMQLLRQFEQVCDPTECGE